jgi:hypothetical protein
MLTGEYFTENVLPTCHFTEEQMQKRQVRMRDWINERQLKFQERDRLRKWVEEWQNSENIDTKELIGVWQKKRREYTVEQWLYIYEMKDNHLLSTNDLLRLYREETAPAARKTIVEYGSLVLTLLTIAREPVAPCVDDWTNTNSTVMSTKVNSEDVQPQVEKF